MRMIFNLLLSIIGLVACAGIYVLLVIECPNVFGNKRPTAWKIAAWVGIILTTLFIIFQIDFTGKPRYSGTIEDFYRLSSARFLDNYVVTIEADGVSKEFSTSFGIVFDDVDEEHFHKGDNVTIWGSTWGNSFYRMEHTELR